MLDKQPGDQFKAMAGAMLLVVSVIGWTSMSKRNHWTSHCFPAATQCRSLRFDCHIVFVFLCMRLVPVFLVAVTVCSGFLPIALVSLRFAAKEQLSGWRRSFVCPGHRKQTKTKKEQVS